MDVVITSTGSSQPIISAKQFSAVHRRRRYRSIFIIDIALPRDVESAVGDLENVYLYNLDDLQQVVSKTQSGRTSAIEAAKRIIDTSVYDYIDSQRARAMGPLIDRLYKRYHQLATDELNRTLNKLPEVSEKDRAQMEELTRRIVNKLLHDPVQALRKAGELHGTDNPYLHAMEQLFKLSANESDDSSEG